MTAIVLGTVLMLVGLMLALNVGGLGAAWIKADLRWTSRKSDEVMLRRERRRQAYLWFLALFGAVIAVSGIISVL